MIGVLGSEETEDARIAEVLPASPAERAGVQAGDLVTQFGTKKVESFDDLKKFVNQRQPGDEVTLEIERGGELMRLKVVLASIRGVEFAYAPDPPTFDPREKSQHEEIATRGR